jgi:hypothetical protein
MEPQSGEVAPPGNHAWALARDGLRAQLEAEGGPYAAMFLAELDDLSLRYVEVDCALAKAGRRLR